MDEYGLKELITHVKAGRLSRRGFVQMMVGLGPDRAHGGPDARVGRGRPGAVQAGLQADQARRRRSAQDAVVAGRHPAQSVLRRRHQGPGRVAHLLRAPGLVGSGRQSLSRPRRRNPDRPERRAFQGRQDDRVEAEEGRAVARRQALHRRRRRLQLGVRGRSGHRRRLDRHLQGHQGREDRQPSASASPSPSPPRSGPTPSSGCAA